MVLDTVYLCMCQNKEEAPKEIEMENLGMSNDASARQNAELQPMK